MSSTVLTRTLTAVLGAALAVSVLTPAATADPPDTAPGQTEPHGWELADQIRKEVKPPRIPQRPFDVTDYGADPTGQADSTEAIADAIDAAAEQGGGKVVVPAGEFHTGAIHLRSNIELHVSDGATVRFSQDPDDYLPAVKTRWEGVELYNYSPFIYAHGAEDVAITGGGTLDGQADDEHWWPWKEESNGDGGVIETEHRDQLFQWAADGVPVEQRRFEDSKLRPNFVQFYESENILVEDVTLTNSPMWMIHPVLSENVTVDGVTLDSPVGPNSDGVNPESSKNVVIKNSSFDNGDDCIAIKSGRNEDGRRIGVPSENIVIHDNTMADGHGGVTIGSEMSGDVYNVFAEDNVMDSENLDRALRIKTNSVRGGTVEQVYFRDNDIPQIGGEVIRINFQYEEGDAGEHTPTVRDIRIENVHSTGGAFGLYLLGYEQSPISDVTIRDSTFADVDTPMELEHVRNLRLENVGINGERYDEVIDVGASG
ncbi:MULTISPECIES: glycoside hydrolase family 28 protein [Prauserella salsuginis group]|uniref:Glycoside hydrolase family 28 protein n=1 Tax=Prauserella salsuginis TaxID=387889 RepID=A0ABW6G1U0_9PSEU|nr:MULTISPECIES: glycoside hydrolase family 28 protein [Prauserella salsuginis group]MCR3722266.1 Polygalacturonase [Prauserella flava]MCR3736264.1 Polygalacturonase [Prauserella salsuginis]